MVFIKAAYRLFRKKLMLNILLILQISACVIILYALLTYILSTNAEYAIASKALSANGGFYAVNHEAFLHEDFSGDDFEDLISVRDLTEKYSEEIKNYRVASATATKISNGQDIFVEGINNGMMNYFDFPLLKGKMFDSMDAQSDEINAVTSFGKVGESFEADLFLGAGTERLTFRITGVLRQSFPYFRMKGSITELSWVFNWGKETTDRVVLCDLDALHAKGISMNLHYTNLFIFNENISDIRAEEIISDIKAYGSYYPLSELKAQSVAETKSVLNTFFPLLIILTLTALSNFAMATVLFTFAAIKDISIMYLCGAKHRDANTIIILYAATICFVSITLLTILINYAVPSMAFIRASLDFWIAIAMIVGVCGVFFAIALFSSKIVLRQRNISMILRRG